LLDYDPFGVPGSAAPLWIDVVFPVPSCRQTPFPILEYPATNVTGQRLSAAFTQSRQQVIGLLRRRRISPDTRPSGLITGIGLTGMAEGLIDLRKMSGPCIDSTSDRDVQDETAEAEERTCQPNSHGEAVRRRADFEMSAQDRNMRLEEDQRTYGYVRSGCAP